MWKDRQFVFWCFGVFVFWLKFKSQVKGLAEGGEVVFWFFGVLVKSAGALRAGSIGELVIWCFGDLVIWSFGVLVVRWCAENLVI